MPADPAPAPLVVGITGASGAAYAVRLLEVLLEAGREVHLAVSPSGQAVIELELGRRLDLDRFEAGVLFGGPPPAAGRLRYCHHKNLMEPIASGSFLTGGMVICPCSGSTLSAVARNSSDAYTYLNESVEQFPSGEALATVVRQAGFSSVDVRPLTFGIATLYVATKGPAHG